MSIQVFCPECKTSTGLDAEFCSKCKKPFGRSRKYRVQVSVKGKRKTRVTDNLTIAREVESSIKADIIREEFDITLHQTKEKPVTLNDVWEKYLPWAKEHKRTWRIDQYDYQTHLEPRFGSKTLENVSNLDVEKLRIEMKRGTSKQGRPYTAATIKHQLVILKRLYNLSKRWGLYLDDNPMDRVEVPRQCC